MIENMLLIKLKMCNGRLRTYENIWYYLTGNVHSNDLICLSLTHVAVSILETMKDILFYICYGDPIFIRSLACAHFFCPHKQN